MVQTVKRLLSRSHDPYLLMLIYRTTPLPNYDRRHAVHPLPSIPDDSQVWVTTESRQTSDQIVSRANTPQSYVVQMDSEAVRRNRQHLTGMPKTPMTKTPVTNQQESTSSERNTIMI